MCLFKSAIIVRDPKTKGGFNLLHSAWTDSHEDLVRLFKLVDTKYQGEFRFARVEFSPKEIADLDKPEKYNLRIDEARTPGWFDSEMQYAVSEKMRGLITSLIIRGEADLLIGGEFILTKGARVACVKTARILVMLGNATINYVRGSATINYVRDSATINYVRDSATINDVGGNATINDVGDSATINYVGDSATINYVGDSATIRIDRRIKKS